jgi:hypothetical protein
MNKLAIIRAHFEERGVLTVPLIEHLFDEVAALAKLKTDRPLVCLTAGVTFHPQFSSCSDCRSHMREMMRRGWA